MTHMGVTEYSRRWYDHIGRVTLLLLLSEKLPTAVRGYLAADLSTLIDHTRQEQQSNLRDPLSMGAEKILGLYRAARRRRWYDATPETHRAFNRMSALPPALLEAFAENALERELSRISLSSTPSPENKTLAWISNAETGAISRQQATKERDDSPEGRHDAYRLSRTFGL